MEITYTAVQTVLAGQNIQFNATPVSGNCGIIHREGSGIVTLRGLTNQCRARYKVGFGGNIAVPTGGTLGAIQLNISLSGEPLASTTMIVTPASVGEYFNVGAVTFVDVPKGCCVAISVENTTATSVNVQNANLVVERVA